MQLILLISEDMLNLGEKSSDYHAEIGRKAGMLGIDHILCVGEESRHMFRAAEEYVKAKTGGSRCMDRDILAETAKEHGSAEAGISWFPDTPALMKALAADPGGLVPEGSTVLVKASHDMGFGEVLKFLRERAEEETFIKS